MSDNKYNDFFDEGNDQNTMRTSDKFTFNGSEYKMARVTSEDRKADIVKNQEQTTQNMEDTDIVEELSNLLLAEKYVDALAANENATKALIEEEKAAASNVPATPTITGPTITSSTPQQTFEPYVSPEEKADKEAKQKAESEAANEARIEEAQDEMSKEFLAMQEEHLVRGAMMRCQCGSHYRRLNLPVSHGMYESQRPLMNEGDSLVGDTYNIPTFGVCNSSDNKTGGSVLLKKDVPRDEFGRKISEESEGNVRGTPCTPGIITQWLCPHEGTIVDGKCAITPTSFLVCQYGGIIEVVNSGQNEEETKI